MTLIEAINDMLAIVGESPIDETDADYTSHPLYESALRILSRMSKAIQSKGWWFNTYTTTLTPVAGAVSLSPSVLTVNVLQRYGATNEYTIRNGALYDLTDNTAVIDTQLTAVVRTLVEFVDLPETAASYIAASACVKFAKTYDGDVAKITGAQQDEAAAFVAMNTDHIRNSRVNVFTTASMSPILTNNWYSRYRQR